MLPEVLAAVSPQAGETYIDATFGNGGYSEALLKSASCAVIGLDRDPNVGPRANSLAAAYNERFSLIETSFSGLDQFDATQGVDAVIFDIGVSSMQLDQAERGFSFMRSGPLDMRMSQNGVSAADAVQHLSIDDLISIFKIYGEERQAKRIAHAIVELRESEVIATTDQLAELIEKTVGRRGKIHPATRVFQALRIYINDELGELYRGLRAAETVLKPEGRLVVVTFHSLEDRMVKQFLRGRTGEVVGGSRHMPEAPVEANPAQFTTVKRGVIKPSTTEVAENPRSRSAKLRYAYRTKIAAKSESYDGFLPQVTSLSELGARL
ncbi:MAG: 16S rRNA (cytosine(1402)-N(4))-methyltransferase RsmH [Maricaulaceae bacterium]